MMRTRLLFPLLCSVLLLALSACGGPLVNASGQLTYKGNPVPSTLVTFWPVDGKRMSAGVTNDEGHFTLTYSRSATGVLRGEHTVTLSYFPSEEEESGKIKPKVSKELKAIFAKYKDAKSSTLKYEIKENGQFIDLKVE